ncbi:hypothetical protein BDR06DRAFT_1005872 [Suillus hirtellus]|nr:hypothetical protein BDR06DRAFT_1005872 [Suillus hirtellus]
MANLSSVNKRPFHSVANPLYIEEVNLSHPNIHVPSPRMRFIAKIAYVMTVNTRSLSPKLQTDPIFWLQIYVD